MNRRAVQLFGCRAILKVNEPNARDLENRFPKSKLSHCLMGTEPGKAAAPGNTDCHPLGQLGKLGLHLFHTVRVRFQVLLAIGECADRPAEQLGQRRRGDLRIGSDVGDILARDGSHPKEGAFNQRRQSGVAADDNIGLRSCGIHRVPETG